MGDVDDDDDDNDDFPVLTGVGVRSLGPNAGGPRLAPNAT